MPAEIPAGNVFTNVSPEEFLRILSLVILSEGCRPATKTKIDFDYTYRLLSGNVKADKKKVFGNHRFSSEIFKESNFMRDLYDECAIRCGTPTN